MSGVLDMGIRSRAFLISGIATALIGGCADVPVSPVSKPVVRPAWPEPPDVPRFVYEAVLRDSSSIRAGDSESDRLRRLMTGEAEVRAGLRKPLSVAARGGRIYVSDTEARRVFVFDVPRRRFFALGYRFEGELRKPAGMAIDGARNVYVADVSGRRVVKYDALGLYIAAFGGAADLERPTGVAVNAAGDRVYVIDAGGVDTDERHRVVAYDQTGRRLFVIGRRGAGAGEFNLPVDGAVAPDGTLYVLDAGNFRVQAFAPDGRFLRSFGAVGNGAGQFARPRGIAVDRVGNVYVTDAGFANVQVFDPAGRLLLALGGRGAEDGPGRYQLPSGVAVDETGRVYVVDQYFHKVEVLRALSDAEGSRLLQASTQ